MRRERVLGSDPTPGSVAAVDQVLGVLRESVLALSRARRGLEQLLATQACWQGTVTAQARTELSGFARDLRRVEDAVVEHAAAQATWRELLALGGERADELTERVAALPGPNEPDSAALQARLGQEVTALAAEHDRAAATLERAADDLAAAVAPAPGDEPDALSAALGRDLAALEDAVQDWVLRVRADLLATQDQLGDATAVATTVTALIGVPGDVPGGDDPRVAALAESAPAAYRLQALLRSPLPAVAAPLLAPAGVATSSTISKRLRGTDAAGAGEATGNDGDGPRP